MRRASRGACCLVIAIAVAAACAPPPSGPLPPPSAPTISAFWATSLRTEAPVTATLGWVIGDANGDVLTCRVDADGNGSWDRTINACSSANLALANFLTAGTRTPRLEVQDTTFPAVSATTTVAVSPGPSEPFSVTLRLRPGMRSDFAQAFTDAATRWQQVIVAGVPDQPFELNPLLVPWAAPFNGVVDDVLIDATDVEIDGLGGTLGQASSLAVRSDGTAYYGIMQFDTADLDRLAERGQLYDVILHEMGHVLGMGLGWALRGLLTDLFTTPRYTGPAANAAYQELGGTGLVPVEDEGGIGTALAHWSEARFGNELMTGYADLPPSPLSTLTVGGMADLGYGVNLAAADTYTLPGPSEQAVTASGDDVPGVRHDPPVIVGSTDG